MAKDLLQKMDLEKFADKIVHSYSGGTKRKLALAVALLGEPPILYLVSVWRIKTDSEEK